MHRRAKGQRFWPERWWRWIDYRIGIIPVPIYIVLVGLVATLVYTGEVKSDGPTMIAVLALGGFTCAEIGKRSPILRNIGAAAIFATFIPSALVYYHLIPAKLESSIVRRCHDHGCPADPGLSQIALGVISYEGFAWRSIKPI